ncbi:MAG TPA: GNAT family N-acetyltransferase [Rhodobacteraceae bacterium]|jgi:GNAT superfamily N-acetyltransferase|nr:GNAT family N-acetyltransferase [Paracoccaceae bacterium]HBV55831.1 GNAT family N-acetyltransferase [Paracoccaceae bacterium]
MLEIRSLTASDEAEWRRLWHAYLLFYETQKPEDVYASTWARLVSADHPNQCGLLACKDGVAIGLVHYIFHPSNWTIGDVCYLQDLYADPAVRGSGVGRALIEAVYAKADTHGAASVYWLTQEFNTTARHLYDRIAKVTPFIRYVR